MIWPKSYHHFLRDALHAATVYVMGEPEPPRVREVPAQRPARQETVVEAAARVWAEGLTDEALYAWMEGASS